MWIRKGSINGIDYSVKVFVQANSYRIEGYVEGQRECTYYTIAKELESQILHTIKIVSQKADIVSRCRYVDSVDHLLTNLGFKDLCK